MVEFFKPYTFTEGKVTVTAKSIMDQMQTAGVTLFIGSHHHSGQILAFKYGSATGTLSTGTNIKSKRLADIFQCLTAPTNFAAPNQDYATDCAKKDYAVTGSLVAPMYLFVVVVGNTGRFFDPIEKPLGTYAKLLFGRAKTDATIPAGKTLKDAYQESTSSNNYGGATVNFSVVNSKNTIVVSFFDVKVLSNESNGRRTFSVQDAATLTITDGTNAVLKSVDDHTTARNARRKTRKNKIKK